MTILFSSAVSAQQPDAAQAGSIRGMVYDKDFDVPLGAAKISIAETGETIASTEQGNFVFGQVPPGAYTIVFTKDGYERHVQSGVVVQPGRMTDIEARLSGEITEMEEFVVQDLKIGGTEAGLLMLRVESPALLDSISSELISKAGAGDAAGALKLVAGATVQDGKYAVIRGLPDRYVSSQMNGVRLPSADADKRAVELDQFPSEIIESVQVSKTFTPDQQGDASGGAVNIVLKGIPDEAVFKCSAGTGYNTQTTGKKDFLTYKGGGVNFWGKDDGSRNIPPDNDRNGAPDFNDTLGTSRGKAPFAGDFSMSAGGKLKSDYDVTVGGFASAYYKRYSSSYENGVKDDLYLDTHYAGLSQKIGDPLSPRLKGQADILSGMIGETSLFDTTRSTDGVKWGGLGVAGVEFRGQSLKLLFMQSLVTEDTATLAEDIRGKQYFFPGHDPNDFSTPGNGPEIVNAFYHRAETLEYKERTTDTLQFSGKHKIPTPEFGLEKVITVLSPQADWTVSRSSAEMDLPDKRLFNELWWPRWDTVPARHYPLRSGGASAPNTVRIWETIKEDSDQYSVNLKLPFKQWSDTEGYVKFGLFHDQLDRSFKQEGFANQGQVGNPWPLYPPLGPAGDSPFSDHFSSGFSTWPDAAPLVPQITDVDYNGEMEIDARYYMIDFPFTSFFKVIGGTRYETTKLSMVNFPEDGAIGVLPGYGSTTFFQGGNRILDPETGLPGGDVKFEQEDHMPAYGFVVTPFKNVTLRGSKTWTVARQTFKELSPVIRQEYLGGDMFVGNPHLKMPKLVNKDLRMDINYAHNGLFSISYFAKDVTNPIEYIQSGDIVVNSYTIPENFPSGKLNGYEFELRNNLGYFGEKFKSLTLGANATFINSEVTIPEEEVSKFKQALDGQSPVKREMMNAPERLLNLYVTYQIERLGSELGLFYTLKGDTLVLGGKGGGAFIPDVYAKEYETLDFILSQKIGKNLKLKFSAKNLTDPLIREIYRSEFIAEDTVKTSYRKGRTYSLSLSGEW